MLLLGLQVKIIMSRFCSRNKMKKVSDTVLWEDERWFTQRFRL